MPRSVIAAIILILLSSPALIRADVKDDLQGIRKEISNKRSLLKKNKKIEKKVSGELERIEKSLKEKETALKSLGTELAAVEATLGRTGREIERAAMEAENKRQQIRRRLVALYKGGEMGSARMFFASESFPRMLENQRYMQGVLEGDRRLFREYSVRIEQLKGLKGVLEKDVDRKERLLAGIAAKKQEIEDEKAKKAAFLANVRESSKSHQASLRELQANARRLQAMIERLEAGQRKGYTAKSERKGSFGDREPLPPVADKGFAAQRGRLAVPVRGDVVGRFGRHKHPEYNSYTVNNGLSITAPLGADIRSVFDGQVIFADYFKGYGNMVIVDHGGGYFSLYGHASRIGRKVGSQVSRNEVIASVGDMDSSRGPMLYFELRYQGKPIDPSPWFR